MTGAPGEDAHRRIVRDLECFEAPGINTLIDGHSDIVLAAADGVRVTDMKGHSYLDLVGGFGVALLGHRHPVVLAAVADQMERLVHGLGDVYANEPRARLARRLARRAPWKEAKVYPAISGADAVEIALKTAVLATARRRVLAFEPAYHGLTLGALQPTSREVFRSPFEVHAADYVTRLPFGCDPKRVHDALGGGEFAAMIFEPVVGREGVLFPPNGWLAEVIRAARAFGTISIADEIFTGFHRSGPRFAHLEGGEAADLICCGKGLGGGLPIGAVLGRAEILDAWRTDGEARHTATFVGHPLACAAANAVLDVLADDWVAERIAVLESAFSELDTSVPPGVTFRGRGALYALQFEQRTQAKAFQRAARDAGVLVLAGGPDGNVVQLLPPITLDGSELDRVIHILQELLCAA